MLASTTQKGKRVQEGDVLCRLKVGDRAARREATVARFKQAQLEESTQSRLRERGIAAANTASGVIEGDPAQVGSIMQIGSTCATIVDPDPIRIIGFAPEFRIGDVALGTVGTAKLATGEQVQGTVVFIAQSADPATRTFQIDLSVPNPSYALRDEVTAEITIPLGTRPAHTLPQSALTLDDGWAAGQWSWPNCRGHRRRTGVRKRGHTRHNDFHDRCTVRWWIVNVLVKAAISRARMVFAFIILSVAAGWLAFTGLPKEGSPNIDIPTLYVSVNFPGVSAADAPNFLKTRLNLE